MKINKWVALGLISGIASITMPLTISYINKNDFTYESATQNNLVRTNDFSFKIELVSSSSREYSYNANLVITDGVDVQFNVKVSANLSNVLDISITKLSDLSAEMYKDYFEKNTTKINETILKNLNYVLETTFKEQSFVLTKFEINLSNLDSNVQIGSSIPIDYEIKNKYLEDLNSANEDNENKDNQIKALNNNISSLNTIQIVLIVVIVLLVIAMVIWLVLSKRKKAKKI